MNILQEIDSVLYYENIENFWKKYKFALIGLLVLLFVSVAGFNYYKQSTLLSSTKDSNVIIQLLTRKMQDGHFERVQQALKEVKTTQAKESLTLELAKEYKKQNNDKLFEEKLLSLNSAKSYLVKNISIYMLAEFYSTTDSNKAIEYIDSVSQDKDAFNYSLVQEIKANALMDLNKKEEAETILKTLIQEGNLSTSLQERINIKLEQLK